MRKVIFLSLIILIASAGCLATPGTGSATGAIVASRYDAQQDARIVGLEGIVTGPAGLQALVGSLSTKINASGDSSGMLSRISSLETRLATAESKLATTAAPADTSALSARIKTLEDWKAGLGTGTGTGTPSVPSGSMSDKSILLSSDQDVELWLEWVDPNKNLSEYETRFSNEVEFQFAIKNKSLDSTRKFAIEMRLTPEDNVEVNLTPAYISASLGAWTLTRPTNSGKNVLTMNTASGTLSAGRISRNTVDKYNFRLQLSQTPSVYWKVKFYVEQIED